MCHDGFAGRNGSAYRQISLAPFQLDSFVALRDHESKPQMILTLDISFCISRLMMSTSLVLW